MITEEDKDKLIATLTLQLQEKEKEIAYMTKQAKKFNNEAQKYFEDAYCNDSIYQDKISFAIEQLEKVKEYIKNTSMLMNAESLEDDDLGEKYLDYFMFADNVHHEIDNQIASLKKGVE